MFQISLVSVSALTPIEYLGKRVVTFAMIDAVHGRVDGTARKRFADNRSRLVDGEDFYLLDSSGLSEFRTINPGSIPDAANRVALVTESGYLMLVKSFTDDLAWNVQRQLVNSYFRPATKPLLSRMEIIEIARAAEMENVILKPKAEAHDAYVVGAGFYMISDAWRMASIREDTLTELVVSKADLGWGYRTREGGPIRPVQSAKDAGLVDYKRFATVNADGTVNKGSPVFCFTDRGLNIIMERVAGNKIRQGVLNLVPRAA